MTDRDLLVLKDLASLRDWTRSWRGDQKTIALVPTMGALHEGHIELVKFARRQADRVVASIFVNPTQFAPHEDFERYPRTFESDCDKLEASGCDAVWAPTAAIMYPDGFATSVRVGGPAEGLESDFRPHFFAGVATVCCKLFTQVTPDVAIFGEKDYQQLAVVRTMARDLNLPIEVIGHPTIRDEDGLAKSSRNAYLTAEERKAAPRMHEVLQELAGEIRSGAPIEKSTRKAMSRLLDAGYSNIDYVAVRHSVTLKPVADTDGSGRLNARVLAAAWLGKTRLIDNLPVSSLMQA